MQVMSPVGRLDRWVSDRLLPGRSGIAGRVCDPVQPLRAMTGSNERICTTHRRTVIRQGVPSLTQKHAVNRQPRQRAGQSRHSLLLLCTLRTNHAHESDMRASPHTRQQSAKTIAYTTTFHMLNVVGHYEAVFLRRNCAALASQDCTVTNWN